MAAKYEIAQELLLKRFEDEQYQNGQQIPTEFELVEELGFSRNTIRQALKNLEESGVIYREHGRGSFYSGQKEEGSSEDNSEIKGIIGFVNIFYVDYIYTDIVRGIEKVLSDAGYSLIVANCDSDVEKGIEIVNRLVKQGIKGLVIEPSHYAQVLPSHPLFDVLMNLDIPVVTTHFEIRGTDFSVVSIDDYKAGALAAEQFISNGHTNVGIIYRNDVQAGMLRYQGFCNYFKEKGIALNSDYQLPFKDEKNYDEQGYLLTEKLLKKSNGTVTGIFYYNDYTAIKGYNAIKDAGYNIPNDVSVLGFDDYQHSQFMDPPLSTFRHPKFILGEWTARILLTEMLSEDNIPMKVSFSPILVERKSIKKLN